MVSRSTVCRVCALIAAVIVLTLLLYYVPSNTRALETQIEIGKRHNDQNQNGTRSVDSYGTGEAFQGKNSIDISELMNKEVASCKENDIHNFFTDMEHSFTEMFGTLALPINTRQFLDCCIDLVAILDRLGKALMPVEKDFRQNIKAITEKYETDKEKYSTLAAIIEDEAANGKHKLGGSVSDAILWLGRSIMFMSEMFKHLKTEESFSTIVSLAYEATIKQYHGFFVKAVFSMISPAVPSKDSVTKALSMTAEDYSKSGYSVCLHDSIFRYNTAVVAVCENLRKLLSTYDIELMHHH